MTRSIILFLARVTANVPQPTLQLSPGGDSVFSLERGSHDLGAETEGLQGGSQWGGDRRLQFGVRVRTTWGPKSVALRTQLPQFFICQMGR